MIQPSRGGIFQHGLTRLQRHLGIEIEDQLDLRITGLKIPQMQGIAPDQEMLVFAANQITGVAGGMARQRPRLYAWQYRAFLDPSDSRPIDSLELFGHLEAAAPRLRCCLPSGRIGEKGKIPVRHEHIGMGEIRGVSIQQTERMIAMQMGDQYVLDLFRRDSRLTQCRSRVTVIGSPRSARTGVHENDAIGTPQGETVYIHSKRRLAPSLDDTLPCNTAIGMDEHINRRFENAVVQKDDVILPEMPEFARHRYDSTSISRLKKRGGARELPLPYFISDDHAP